MTKAESEKSESPESSGGWSRWCFVIDTAERIVHAVETPLSAELASCGVELDASERHAPSHPSATITRPSLDAPWWTVAVEGADRHEAGRTALALVEDDRTADGLAEPGFETSAAATPALIGTEAFADLDRRLGDWYDEVGQFLATESNDPQCCKGASAPEYSRTSLVITDVTDGARELVRRSEEFARVRTIRGFLDHSEQVTLGTEDVRLLVEQAEFWQGEFAETYNRSSETIAELRAELDDYREADEREWCEAADKEAEEVPGADAGRGPKPCYEVACPEFEEVLVDFQEATWEVTFDLNGTFIGMNYGDHLKGEPLEAGAEPAVITPDRGDYPGWFTVSVRSTNSTGAVELARAVLREREGITGDAMAVMAGETTVEESGASVRQLGWVRKWAEEQLAVTEGHAAEFRAYVERLEQAGAEA